MPKVRPVTVGLILWLDGDANRATLLLLMPRYFIEHRRRSYAAFLAFLTALLPTSYVLRRQPLKQGAGSLQIRGREAFGEPIIDRSQRRSRLVVTTLAYPQAGDTESDTQLPK
jgi:hypothetical protein